MEKIIIIGSPGAGKTTLAKAMGSELEMKVFHLDRFFWRRGWIRKTSYERMEILDKLVLGEKRWIIEGSYIYSCEPGLETADTIIYLELQTSVCLWRRIERHFKDRGRYRRDIPDGCTDKLTLGRILKVLMFPFHDRNKIKHLLQKYASKNIITFYNPKEVDDFLTQRAYRCISDERVPELCTI